jgi:hypothetical protein
VKSSEKHDLEFTTRGGDKIYVDRQPRGGLLIQIGVERLQGNGFSRRIWNSARISRRHLKQLLALLCDAGVKP